MKNIFIIFYFFTLSICSYAQQKNYSGIYEFGAGIKGTANYQYYENADRERIINGDFKFNGKGNSQNTFNLIGHFNNGKMNGEWTSSSYCAEISILGKKFKAHRIFEKGQFINGKREGKWTLTNIAADNSNRNELTAFFKGDRPVGNWSYYETETRIKFQCQFNENGYLHGEWTYNYFVDQIPFEDFRKYKNGVMYFRLFQNLFTGKIIDKRDYPGFVDSFFNNFSSSANISYVDSIPYFLEPGGERQVQGYDILKEQFRDLDDNLLFERDVKKVQHYAEIEQNSALLERMGIEKKEAAEKKSENERTKKQESEDSLDLLDNLLHDNPTVKAEFPGGSEAWSRFLNRNFNGAVASENGAPLGTYIVNVTFIVDRLGNLSDIEAENDAGYGTRNEAIRIIKMSRKWVPAKENGRDVKSKCRIAITFKAS